MIENKNDTREYLVESLIKELLGPGSERFSTNENEELIWEPPSKRYLTGILYPMATFICEDNMDLNINEGLFEASFEEQNEKEYSDNTKGETPIYDNNTDEILTLSNQFKPSSMGLTFYFEGNIKELAIDYTFAKYVKADRKDITFDLSEEQTNYMKSISLMSNFTINNNVLELVADLKGNEIIKIREQIKNIKNKHIGTILRKMIDYNYAYKRIPTYITNQKFAFSNYDIIQEIEDNNIRLFVKRKYYKQIDRTCFTVVMINNSEDDSEKNIIFQPKISISSSSNYGKLAHYITNPYLDDYMTEEEKNLELLFRNKQKFGIGHGVSINYKINKDVWLIETSFIPDHEVESMNFDIEDISDELLSMENLSSISKFDDNELIKLLTKFVDYYKNWINSKSKEAELLAVKYNDSAKINIEKSKVALKRMYSSIKVLEDNPKALCAFKDANYAMLMQRVQVLNRKKSSFPDDKMEVVNTYKNTELNNAKWRAFQLAFFLMSIESIVNDDSEFRGLVDLIWVPTGGGKTEAYLALTAFTIFNRRLRTLKDSAGTAVIMRYTLRLLAAQQFVRATVLICACELIRKDNIDKYGNEEISVGLWIGGNVTPNTMKEANCCYKKLIEKTDQYNIDENYKFQLLECPWCGTKLIKEKVGTRWKGQYGIKKIKNDIIHKCTNSNCDFFKKLPITVVDEYIYDNPPTLLFGTVDKFATLPWKGEISEIFATSNDYIAAPELIIQDELHLISGPLGTIVGLYESVIDFLCSHKGKIPKIIASTATIRNADEQVKNLYNRKVSQFPPPVLDIDDSYFIKTNKIEEKFGRKYLGIMGSGKTQTTVEVRLIGKLLQSIYESNCSDECKDAYWTLVGYFNSIRELGKCTTLVNDDIKDFTRRLANRYGNNTRIILQSDELTSRVSSNEIIKTLDKLEKNYNSENQNNKVYISDIVLATNMISVGVDVSRLNTMVVIGQPKLTAEYIQASSRVGRRDPGLVCTLYDSAKTRDRSHYENFESYHNSFYYYVEPTSLTPFSEAAVDRTIHSLIITLMRHYYGFNEEQDAEKFDINGYYVNEIKFFLLERAKSIDPDSIEMVEKKINDFFKFWQFKLSGLVEGQNLTYSKKMKNSNSVRLIKDFGLEKCEEAFETLRAMRNVDTETRVHIRRLDNE